ncbi:flagellar hook-length control protein FliK [Alicyclobacillaceae bacterium I2511]|nr:flagellar hook-length control protein FliK [Alicyclobacillaceae bacterium I2511]
MKGVSGEYPCSLGDEWEFCIVGACRREVSLLSIGHSGIPQDGTMISSGESQRVGKSVKKKLEDGANTGFALLMQGMAEPKTLLLGQVVLKPAQQGKDCLVSGFNRGEIGSVQGQSLLSASPHSGKLKLELADKQDSETAAPKSVSTSSVGVQSATDLTQQATCLIVSSDTAAPRVAAVAFVGSKTSGEQASAGLQTRRKETPLSSSTPQMKVVEKMNTAVQQSGLAGRFEGIKVGSGVVSLSMQTERAASAQGSTVNGKLGLSSIADPKMKKTGLWTDENASSNGLLSLSPIPLKTVEFGQTMNNSSPVSVGVTLGESTDGRVLGTVVSAQLQDNVSQLQVHVHPQSMGELLITAVQTQGQVYVHILASTAATVHWLQQVTPDLIAAVQLAGFSEARVDIDLGSGQGDSKNQFISSGRIKSGQRIANGETDWNLPVAESKVDGKNRRYGDGSSKIDLHV